MTTFPASILFAVVATALMLPTAHAGPRSAVPPISDPPIEVEHRRPMLVAASREENRAPAPETAAPEAQAKSNKVRGKTPAKPVSRSSTKKAANSPATPATAVVVGRVLEERSRPANSLLVATTLGEIGYADGFRLSNLGGRQEVFVPLPQGSDVRLSELVLVLDDVSAHESRRSLEILVNDRSAASVALDGKSTGRTIRIPLTNVVPRDGFLKVSIVYSGAATIERCIDVRYVGDSLTIRPESAVDLMFAKSRTLNITATATLMPHNVAVVLSSKTLSLSDIAAALTLARSLSAAGRRVSFHHGVDVLPRLIQQQDPQRWDRGLVIVGPIANVAGKLDAEERRLLAGTSLMSARMNGVPVLLVADAASARDGRLLGNPTLAALRDTRAASVGATTAPKGPTNSVSFDHLGLVPVQAEVYGRADMALAIPTSLLPSGTRPSRLGLDVMVAPDGNDQKAVVSVFVNERLLDSTVAAIGEPTRLDFPLPDGLVGTIANIRVVVQRRSAQGDCRFEPQGYPAEILGSSAVILAPAGAQAQDFSDLAGLWGNGVEVLIPESAAARPLTLLGMLSDVLNALSRETAPINVKLVAEGIAPSPKSPFVAVSEAPPAGARQPVKFDRGRVTVIDRAGRTRLDLGGLTSGAVAQIVTSNKHPGLWIKPLSADGSLPVSAGFSLDRGDVALLDKTGVALAMSTQRDTLLRISYPERSSWLMIAERFRSWIVGGLWFFATIIVLAVLQKIYRRRRSEPGK